MSDRETAIRAATANFDRFMPDVWNGEDSEHLGSSFRYFAEQVVGLSIANILPHLEAIKSAADGTRIRVTNSGKGETVQVRHASGKWFGIRSENRPPKPGRNNEVGPEGVDVVISRPDPDRLDYPYPERIAFGTIINYPDRQFANGTCSLGDFGDCVDALRAFAAAAGLSLPPVPVEDIETKGSFPYAESNGVLALDGGIAGETCREAAARMSASLADRIMRRAQAAFPAVADALESEGAVWGRGRLMYNDLDNSVTMLPAEVGGGRAIIHHNSSYISDYRTYVLVQSEDGKTTSLYALQDSTDDFRTFMGARALYRSEDGSRGLSPVATLSDGQVSLHEQFDTTGVISTMAFGLRCIEEIVIEGDRMDVTIEADFDVFDTRSEDEIGEDDEASPNP